MLLSALLVMGCEAITAPASSGMGAAAARAADGDHEHFICTRRIAALKERPAAPGLDALDDKRVLTIGRNVGASLIFVEPPQKDKERKHLRGGYLYDDDPTKIHRLVKRLKLTDLFKEDEIWLQRGQAEYVLRRVRKRIKPYFGYQHADGRDAKVLFADRVALEAMNGPLHRDIGAFAERVGFDRIRIDHLTRDALAAGLRFGALWVDALVTSQGAELALSCMAAPRADRARVAAHLERTAGRRASIAALRIAIDKMIDEKLPFDRPHSAEDHTTDGRLRPQWDWSFNKGRKGFGVDDRGYPIFDKKGRPHPPQTCVAMVLDAFERAAGTWYPHHGQAQTRTIGRLDFDAFGIENRSGVLAFEKFAKEHPELFEHRRFPDNERIPFARRQDFFDYLQTHAALFEPGDIVAIQGLKRDGNIHQHAILIESVDPITGFPHGLVDQMKRPRRRSWEGIMAEAPRRSLLYHLKPKAALLAKLAAQQ